MLFVSAASPWSNFNSLRLVKLWQAQPSWQKCAMALHRLAAVEWPISSYIERQALRHWRQVTCVVQRLGESSEMDGCRWLVRVSSVIVPDAKHGGACNNLITG